MLVIVIIFLFEDLQCHWIYEGMGILATYAHITSVLCTHWLFYSASHIAVFLFSKLNCLILLSRPSKEKNLKERGCGFNKQCELSLQLQTFTGVPNLARPEVCLKFSIKLLTNLFQVTFDFRWISLTQDFILFSFSLSCFGSMLSDKFRPIFRRRICKIQRIGKI